MRDLRALPKGHLHLHLDGALRPETLAELAAAAGVAVPQTAEYHGFASFMATLLAAQQVIARPDDLARVVHEVVADAADDGARWVEVSVWPGFLRGRLGSEAEVLDLILEESAQSAAARSIGVGVMVAANRDAGSEAALNTAHLAAARAGVGVVSFGLDGDELAAPPEQFSVAFAVATEAGLAATPHAGELAGPESVAAAVDVLGGKRVLHGIRAIEDAQLVERLMAEKICLDVCPTSNVMLSAVPTQEAHPLPDLLARGVPCSVNADDPLLFGSSLLDEYTLLREVFGFTDQEIAQIAVTSLQLSQAPPHLGLVAQGVADINAWVDDET
jgi:adenosine deaminase